MSSQQKKVKKFWNERAKMGVSAGSDDVIAKQIEINAIMEFMKDGLDVLDVGCGNGITAIAITEKHNLCLKALDYAEEMVSFARELASKEKLKGSLTFDTGDVRQLSEELGFFDVIYSERVLINLDNWEEQKQAIDAIGKHLKPGGIYVMCENSLEGLESINALRVAAELSKINPPWHNRYFKESEIAEFIPENLELEEVRFISSTYAFLSRVVNAWLAQKEGEEPSYDAPVNKLALELPAFGGIGQTKIWVWRKK